MEIYIFKYTYKMLLLLGKSDSSVTLSTIDIFVPISASRAIHLLYVRLRRAILHNNLFVQLMVKSQNEKANYKVVFYCIAQVYLIL